MELKKSLGFINNGTNEIPDRNKLTDYINLKLAALGQPVVSGPSDSGFIELANDLIRNYREKSRLLSAYLCPADQRIQNFIDAYLEDLKETFHPRIPSDTFITDRHGIARALSLPADKDVFISDIISSYRIKQGVLHNPKTDRRTTMGVFHIAEGGLPIPDDKKSVPKGTFACLLFAALQPPKELLQLPFTSSNKEKAEVFVSLLLKPVVCPAVPGFTPVKKMEIRFLAPGNLVSNLDFVESIFGNEGDPFLPENDSAIDIDSWTGHSGCIILAPHLVQLTKKEVGLPHFNMATDRQKLDGMCWREENEKYNDGNAFKITARTGEGVILTIIADNYFGYSKKEVKSHISYSANLFGNAEEEHAGGAIAFPNYNLGDEFRQDSQIRENGLSYSEMVNMYGSFMTENPEGYAIDRNYPDVFYVPQESRFSLIDQKISWKKGEEEISIRLHPAHTYILPSGYKIRMEKNPSVPSWRLIGAVAEGTFVHKPCTVSGGGKSEISKSISDAIIYGPYFIADFEKDFDRVKEIIDHDYNHKFKDPWQNSGNSRPLLSPARSLGSVIKLLTPSPGLYTDEYNSWLETIPHYIRGLVYVVKRFYKQEWGANWRKYFTVDIIDGKFGNELKFRNRKLVAAYLRVGLMDDKSWRTFKLRQDFIAADKLQMEDDITASTVVPAHKLHYLSSDFQNPALKFTANCEYRFFQRPDDAIHRGYDKQAEADLATPNTFITNFQPLTIPEGEAIMADAIEFDKYTTPIKRLIEEVVDKKDCTYFVSSSHPRMVEGKPSKNMRYLQNRPDIVKHREKYIAETGTRLFRRVPADQPVLFPVNDVMPGRRNNPPEPGVRSLAVFNPIHYQELPELFMDFICSLTGKSPSTTGAGSEGALTKGPFNSLSPIIDLNNALVSYILTGYPGFTTASGYIGPRYRVDHDISLLVPEIWSRLRTDELNPACMIENGMLEKLEDFEYQGHKILASRLGYRITGKFIRSYFGRVFENPDAVFSEDMLKPELQDMESFADGIQNIVEAQQRVAQSYFADGSIEGACPPLKALLFIMTSGEYEGKTIESPGIRKMFTRESLLSSDWYRERLLHKQLSDIALFQKHVKYLKNCLISSLNMDEETEREIHMRLRKAEERLKYLISTDYLKSLEGTIGLDPFVKE
jgi:phosphoenolpyruvate carboxykinase (diphosphate)